MKTAELIGPALDAAVAKTFGLRIQPNGKVMNDDYEIFWFDATETPFSPSTSWGQGGAIIERARIAIEHGPTEARHGLPHPEGIAPWHAWVTLDTGRRCFAFGDAPLIAAMRAYVASELGEEVPDDAPA